jgi:hypothetical protein
MQLQCLGNLFRSRDRATSPIGWMLIAGCRWGEEVSHHLKVSLKWRFVKKIYFFYIFLNYFNVLILKIKKYYFNIFLNKNILKNNFNHTSNKSLKMLYKCYIKITFEIAI